jgi:hypothetical protein
VRCPALGFSGRKQQETKKQSKKENMKVINTLFLTASLGLAAAPSAWAAVF